MTLLRTTAVLLAAALPILLAPPGQAEGPADPPGPKPTGSASTVEPPEPPSEAVPVRGAKKKSDQKPFRPSVSSAAQGTQQSQSQSAHEK